MRGRHRKERCPYCQSTNTKFVGGVTLKRDDIVLIHFKERFNCRGCGQKFKKRVTIEAMESPIKRRFRAR